MGARISYRGGRRAQLKLNLPSEILLKQKSYHAFMKIGCSANNCRLCPFPPPVAGEAGPDFSYIFSRRKSKRLELPNRDKTYQKMVADSLHFIAGRRNNPALKYLWDRRIFKIVDKSVLTMIEENFENHSSKIPSH